MSRVAASFLALMLAAVLTAWTHPVLAQIASINQQGQTAAGTYYYPVDTSGSFSPGYFYVAVDTTVTFTISSGDGTSLHIFSDAAGTTELSVPSALHRAGIAQSMSDPPQMGDVLVTAGWHKLYVEHTILTSRADPSDCMCRLWYSAGQLYQKMEAVQPDYSIAELQAGASGTYTAAVSLTLVTPNGGAASGDSLTWAVAKVTSDAAGLCSIASAGVTISGDASTASDGTANATITWAPPSGFSGSAYVWLTTTDNSRQSLLPTPVTDTLSASAMRSSALVTPVPISNPVVVTPAVPIIIVIPVPVPTPKPWRVNLHHKVSNVYYTGNPAWGHVDTYDLILLDTNANPFTANRLTESFTGVSVNQAVRQFIIGTPPGMPNSIAMNRPIFTDTNGTFARQDTGAGTWWYTVDQWFTATTSYASYKLNRHQLAHYQNHVDRTVY